MNIRHIDIISIPVSDQTVAKAFYADVLGFETIRDNPMGPGQQWIQMKLPDAQTSITLVTWFTHMPAGTLRGMVLDTTDIETAHRELAEKGVRISDVNNTPWGSSATFSDPDGNGWILQQSSISSGIS